VDLALVDLVPGTARTQIADYLSTLITVYIVLIFLYIVLQLLFSVGLRPPYSRALDLLMGFLRDVCEPCLRLFRRVIPQFGPLDLSPMVAILALGLLNSILVQGLLHG
jgi:uncharacterized protein YggT (Ycf19 family)